MSGRLEPELRAALAGHALEAGKNAARWIRGHRVGKESSARFMIGPVGMSSMFLVNVSDEAHLRVSALCFHKGVGSLTCSLLGDIRWEKSFDGFIADVEENLPFVMAECLVEALSTLVSMGVSPSSVDADLRAAVAESVMGG